MLVEWAVIPTMCSMVQGMWNDQVKVHGKVGEEGSLSTFQVRNDFQAIPINKATILACK